MRGKKNRRPQAAGRSPVARFEPIRQENLTHHVYRAIKQRILKQEIEVGSRLRDADLAGQLGVSRTPVREALMRLSRDGLVEIVPRSGTRVRTFTEDDIEQIFDIRIALESLAIKKATPNISDERIARLRELYEKAEVALRNQNTGPALEYDREMHAAILQACGCVHLQQYMATINDYVTLFRNLGARTPYHRGFTYRHEDIIKALERRDATAGVRALAEHINAAKEELFRDFERRQLFKPAGPASGSRAPKRGETRPKKESGDARSIGTSGQPLPADRRPSASVARRRSAAPGQTTPQCRTG